MEKRRYIIDTDTASDDAVALVMALRSDAIHVEAITCTAGNLSLSKTTRNARLSVEFANTYSPKIYAGADRPLVKELVVGENVHGKDGLGDMNYLEPMIALETPHACDVILDYARNNKDLGIITLGPLTNIAMAILLDPKAMSNITEIIAMGGQYRMTNGCTANAEFNIWVDGDAAKIVLESGIPLTLVPLDVCYGEAEINIEDRNKLKSFKTARGNFFVDCNRRLLEYNQRTYNKDIISMPDPTAMAIAIDPSIMLESRDVYTRIELYSSLSYGQLIYDFMNLHKQKPNVRLVTKIDVEKFKNLVFNSAL
jgi:purine nucleosidase